MSFAEDRRGEQWARAERISAELTGGRVTNAIVRAMFALVVADERTDLPAPEPEKRKPVSDARAVMAVRKPARSRRVPAPEQGGLW